LNEFDSLTTDELHFLRVFVQCEGRIRDMEAALGVSYPTVKGLLASIKDKLSQRSPRFAASARSAEKGHVENHDRTDGAEDAASDASPDEILDQLENGQLSHQDAVRRLRAARRKER